MTRKKPPEKVATIVPPKPKPQPVDDRPTREQLKTLQHVIMVQGKVMDDVATEARRMMLSGNPAVSAAGSKILAMIPQ